ncbi:hypothetical protein HYH02_005610 [Chlamydomonas schloesseri]|uniref:Uncharacterized protein n=1 Tax=Chlamydomonas schloesseri TaxID=2026947 RepID=A0A836B748_9CHLO|nr:hypothetical protein HYH02_005610 [Chlamydomonas schloesseri]|eukprot:KAG2449465.1 hypothetical protein HYH02_005610 [Chlamydomonas schloesseri]
MGATHEYPIIQNGELTAEAAAVKAAPQIRSPDQAPDTPLTVRYSTERDANESDDGSGSAASGLRQASAGDRQAAGTQQAVVAVDVADVQLDVKA